MDINKIHPTFNGKKKKKRRYKEAKMKHHHAQPGSFCAMAIIAGLGNNLTSAEILMYYNCRSN
jgi:hypothetical protein